MVQTRISMKKIGWVCKNKLITTKINFWYEGQNIKYILGPMRLKIQISRILHNRTSDNACGGCNRGIHNCGNQITKWSTSRWYKFGSNRPHWIAGTWSRQILSENQCNHRAFQLFISLHKIKTIRFLIIDTISILKYNQIILILYSKHVWTRLKTMILSPCTLRWGNLLSINLNTQHPRRPSTHPMIYFQMPK